MSEFHSLSTDMKKQGLEEGKIVNQENRLEYALDYLKMIQNCRHVVDADFDYILASNHNKKSFVFCLLNSFKEYPPNYELTCNDFYYLIEPLCPGFPMLMVCEASKCVPSGSSTDGKDGCKYFLFNLLQVLSCRILFMEWLKLLEEYFGNESVKSAPTIGKIKSILEEFQHSLPLSILQPRLSTIMTILDNLKRKAGESFLFEDFTRIVFTSSLMGNEISCLAKYPLLL